MRKGELHSAAWFKSSYSNQNGNCVEVAFRPGAVALRDSKQRGSGPVLTATPEAWRAFVAGVARGEFDEPGNAGSGTR